jgi:hypothetical protein
MSDQNRNVLLSQYSYLLHTLNLNEKAIKSPATGFSCLSESSGRIMEYNSPLIFLTLILIEYW